LCGTGKISPCESKKAAEKKRKRKNLEYLTTRMTTRQRINAGLPQLDSMTATNTVTIGSDDDAQSGVP
jgi:hypothetical protein